LKASWRPRLNITHDRLSSLRGLVLLLGCAIGVQDARAGEFDIELRITPEVPRPFQPITVHALQHPCQRFGLNLTALEVLEDNVIRVVVPYEGNLLCSPPSPIAPFQWTIPGVAAGGYRLELMAATPGVPDYYQLGAIEIQVALGAIPEPRVVPSASWIGLGALVLMFAFAAHRSSCRGR
jgi:hypothetical protein